MLKFIPVKLATAANFPPTTIADVMQGRRFTSASGFLRTLTFHTSFVPVADLGSDEPPSPTGTQVKFFVP